MEMSEDHNLIFGANEMFHGRTNGLKMYHSKEEQENFAKIQEINEEVMCKSVENLLSERGWNPVEEYKSLNTCWLLMHVLIRNTICSPHVEIILTYSVYQKITLVHLKFKCEWRVNASKGKHVKWYSRRWYGYTNIKFQINQIYYW